MAEISGRQVGDYQLERLLGQGPSGQVFEARHIRLQRQAAIKVFEARLTAVPGFQQHFGTTLRQAAGLRHPNIVEIYDFGQHEGLVYVAMELVASSLRRQLGQEGTGQLPLSPTLVLGIARQAAEALAFAHQQGLLHGAIKPENLLLNPAAAGIEQGLTLKLTDFGLARLLPDEALSAPAYLSPEQCSGLAVDARSDIYGLGAVLYELATGRPPFVVGSVAEATQQHLHSQPVPPRSLNPAIPPPLEALILRCLAKQPAERFSNAGELLGALRLLGDQQAVRQSNPAPGAVPDPLLAGLLGVAAAAPTRQTGEPVRVEVAQEPVVLTPGAQGLVTVRIVNRSPNADAFSLAVEGVPGSWVVVPDAPVPVAPGGEATVGLLVAPPRTAESRAGIYNVTVRARSVTGSAGAATALARWSVQPFAAAGLAIDPPRAEGRTEAEYQVLLRNEGNADTTFALSAGDDISTLDYTLSQTTVPLAAGQTASIPLRVSAPQRLLGEPKGQVFEVRADTPDLAEQVSAEFVHQPLIRLWVPLALVAALLVLALLSTVLGNPGDAADQVGVQATETPVPTLTPTTEPGAPQVVVFSVAPNVVAPAQPVLVSWDIVGAERVVIDQFGDVPPQGQREFRPEQTTDFRLSAQGGGKETVRIERVTVAQPTALPETGQPTQAPPAPAPTTAPQPTPVPPTEPQPPAPTAVPPTEPPPPPAPTVTPALPPPTATPQAPAPPTAPAPRPEPTLELAPGTIRLSEEASAASWQTNNGAIRFGRPLVGANQGGWADIVRFVLLEDNRLYDTTLYLVPPPATTAQEPDNDEAFVEGLFTIPAIEPGQRFVSGLGFAEEVADGQVQVRVSVGDQVAFEGVYRRDGVQDQLTIDLTPFAGSDDDLALRVITGEGAEAQGIYWVEPRIEGGTP